MQRTPFLFLAAPACALCLGCGNGDLASGSGGSLGGTAETGGTTTTGAGGMPSSGGVSGTVVGAGGTASSGGATARASGGTRGSGGQPAVGGTTSSSSAGAGGSGRTNPRATGGRSGVGGTTGTGGTSPVDAGSGTGGTRDAGTSQWPQCFGIDSVPTAPLKQRAPIGDFQTQVANGGVAMLIGPNRQSCLTDSLVTFDIEDLNQQIKEVVQVVRFYGFLDWKRGYYMNWVILNSGIPGATLSGQGGHQGDRWGHMNFESTEECPCNWGTGNNSNRGNALHESIHALQSELWAFNNSGSGWIHEAHNCYTGTMRAHMVDNQFTMGYGAAYALMMPHGPIESMGMNTDDSWAGPSDQNAKTYVNSIVRYGLEIFWLNVNLEMGQGFINCIWDSASKAGQPDNRRSGSLSVFQAMQRASSDAAIAHVILTFGARSAILDYDGWTATVRNTMKSNWKSNYWFYTFPDGDGTTTFSPPTKSIPHHQGRNIIPIKVAAGATSVTVELTPDATGSKGTKEYMQAQLVYRDSTDQPVYGTVFSTGQSTIDIPNGARNGIVNLVVAVTNPNASSGSDDGSNKGFDAQEHFNYQARIVSGGTVAPASTTPW